MTVPRTGASRFAQRQIERHRRLAPVAEHVSTRLYNSIRAYVGGFMLALGCFGIFISVLLLPLSLVGHSFWTGFSPDGPGILPAQREEAISQAIHSDLLCRFAPWFLGSVSLVCYGFYEAKRQKIRA